MSYVLHLEAHPADAQPTGDCHFLFSNYEMALAVHVMGDFGMITDPLAPDWPDLADYDLSITDFTGAGRVAPGKEHLLAQVQAALENARAGGESEPAGVPGYKLSSNERWLVTPPEITAALAAYYQEPAEKRQRADQGIDRWRLWIEFLHRAGDLAGFRVH